ncbi:MAG: DUF86 domain-containing protein [Magnetococcus sp. DMHC-6]
MNEILLMKKISIERCIKQIDTYYAMNSDHPFEKDFFRQDAIAMNLQRICEMTIDIANHLIKTKKLGLPQESRESFTLLQQAGLIGVEQMQTLQAMVGFRNVLVHAYQKMDHSILVNVIEKRVRECLDFADRAMQIVI